MQTAINRLKKENEALLFRLSEAEETLHAIRNGEVDAVVMNSSAGERIFSLSSAETPYRIIIEKMNEGAVVISKKGLIVYCNQRFADMFGESMEQLTGSDFLRLINPNELPEYASILKQGVNGTISKEIKYITQRNDTCYFRLSFSPLAFQTTGNICVMLMDITELKEKENSIVFLNSNLEEKIKERTAELQKQNKEIFDYKFALDESCIVAITDHTGIVSHVNDNFCKISKYSREELLGHDLRIINSEYHPQEFMHNLWATISAGQIWKGEIKNKAKDGSFYWVDTTIVPFLNSHGKPYQYITIRSDITDRKMADELFLKLNEELEQKILQRTNELFLANVQLKKNLDRMSFLATIAGNIQDPVIAVDKNSIITQWNMAAEKLLGWTSEEVIGKYVVEVLRSTYQNLTREQILEVISIHDYWQGEAIYNTKSGKPLDVLLTSSTLRDGEGCLIGYLAIVRDITERKRAEMEMNFLNNRLVLATASAEMGVWDWDIVNNTLTWDESMFKIYGIDKFNFNSVYDAWFTKLHPEDKERINEQINLAVSGIKEYDTEFRIVAGDGAVRYLRARAISEYNTAGNAIRMTGVNWDITENKKTEAEIKSLNERLEAKIVERTQQLEAANKELESFSYTVSHDLRAPLRAVNSYAQILAEDFGPVLNDDGKKLLENIHYNARKMGTLIDELLTFSHMVRKELDKHAIDMNILMAAVLNDINRTSEHRASIRVGNLPVVKADYTLLRQVLFNLLSNAIKYSSKREHPVVEIFAGLQNNKAVFAVKDNGAGFDMRFVDKLFGVFQRLHSEKEFEGNGVGLAIVQRIISKHGGRVWAEGKVNEGATFYYTLN